MRISEKTSFESLQRGFTLPVLHTGKIWYVDFYAIDPRTGTMRRKRNYIPSSLPVKKKKEHGSYLIAVIIQKLQDGWSPWTDEGTINGLSGFTLLDDCVENYLKSHEKSDRKKTKDSYGSRINMMLKYNASRESPIKYAWEFDRSFCCCFLEWLKNEREVCPRTLNNYRGWLHGFSEYLVNHKNIMINPVNSIPVLPEYEKIRKDISAAMLAKMTNHLEHTDLHFFLACLMQYYTLIRPSELVNLTIGDISISEQCIYIDARYSKNHKSSVVGLNDKVLRVMKQLDIFSYPSNFHVFSKDLLPGIKKGNPDEFSRRWKKLREELGWPSCYQFYSLKDSGIRDLANNEGIVVARDQARHSDISVTNKYIQHHEVHESVKHFNGAL